MAGEHADANNEHERAAGSSNGAGVGDATRFSIGSAAAGCAIGHRLHEMKPIPASVVRALCRVQATVDAVKKSQKNTHGGYMFSSTDDIYAAVTRKLGEVGLVVLAMEEKAEIARVQKKDGTITQWLHAVYSFALATESDTWSDPRSRRTLYIMVTGPQTFQAAQSYAEKAYLRSLLKLPTGDMDLDSMPQGDTEDDQAALAAPPKRKSSAAAKRDGDNAAMNEIRGAISGADGPADLMRIWTSNVAFVNALPTRWAEIVKQEYEDKLADFTSAEDAESAA